MEAKRDATLESVLAELDLRARHGQSIAAVASTWRFAGIVDTGEVRAWLDVGVFDGHRAGLLRMAGVDPRALRAHPDAKRLGFDFAIGKLSIGEIVRVVRGRALTPSSHDRKSGVLTRPKGSGERE